MAYAKEIRMMPNYGDKHIEKFVFRWALDRGELTKFFHHTYRELKLWHRNITRWLAFTVVIEVGEPPAETVLSLRYRRHKLRRTLLKYERELNHIITHRPATLEDHDLFTGRLDCAGSVIGYIRGKKTPAD